MTFCKNCVLRNKEFGYCEGMLEAGLKYFPGNVVKCSMYTPKEGLKKQGKKSS